jgi:DNA polymerase V
MIGLVDCNSFYAACERIFRPDLQRVPVAVLSNNDGCIVAMSSELKALGIKRGAPYFKVRDRLAQLGTAVFSSNYTLYQDLSDRVMDVIGSFGDPIEVYSIDEAFIFPTGPEGRLRALGSAIRSEVSRLTGVPVSVGFGRTKTLAKLAGKIAKHEPDGVFLLDAGHEQEVLRQVNVVDVWGVGTRKARYLYAKGIRSAYDLSRCEDHWIRKHLTLVTLKTVWELRGTDAIERDLSPLPRKGILSSLGFSQGVEDLETLRQAVVIYAQTAVTKLQEQRSETQSVTVFVQTHRYKDDFYSNSLTLRLPMPTAYLPDIIGPALKGLQCIFIEGLTYAKAGVYLSGIDGLDRYQGDLFDEGRDKKRKMAQAVHEVQSRYGKRILTCRAAASEEPWTMKRQMLSGCCTTRWEDLPPVR